MRFLLLVHYYHYHYHYRIRLTAFFPGQPGKVGTRKINHSGFYWSKRWRGGSGISWTMRKSFAPRSRQITTPVSHHSFSLASNTISSTQPVDHGSHSLNRVESARDAGENGDVMLSADTVLRWLGTRRHRQRH